MPQLFHASILALLSIFPLGSYASPLYAAETEVAVGRGFVCDTAQEIKAVATPVDTDISARLASINDRFGEDSCTYATAVFYKGGEDQTVRTAEATVRIIKVELIGYLVGKKLLPMAKPSEQYIGLIEAGPSA